MATFAMAMLACSDLARSRDFYRDVVGLKVTTDSAPHWVDLELAADGARLGLHPRSAQLEVKPGSLQLGFEVDSVDRFVNDARHLGATIFQEPFDESFGRLAVIGDPDGYPVQVYTRKR